MGTFTYKFLITAIITMGSFLFVRESEAQTVLFTEGWESAAIGQVPPTGWNIDLVSGSNYLNFVSNGTNPSSTPYEGTRMVEFNSFAAPSGTQNRLRMITPVSTTNIINITVDFEWLVDPSFQGYPEGVTIQWSTNGTTWASAGTMFSRYGAAQQWVLKTQGLPAGASNQPTLYVGLLFTSAYGSNCHLDIIHIKGTQTGLFDGQFTNCNTGIGLAGVQVTCGGVSAVTNASGVFTMMAPVGDQVVTAVLPGYIPFGPVPVTIYLNQQAPFYAFCMTPLLPPTVVTLPATAIGMTTATLNGTVNPNTSSATTFFQLGLTVAYGNVVPGIPSPVTGSTPCPFFTNMTGLTLCTTYHYRAMATNAAGTSYGADMTFTPGGGPGPAGPITGPTNICPGAWGIVYSISPIAGATGYAWTLPAGFTITSGANSPSITVNTSPGTVSGNVSVYATSGCGNGASSSLWVNVGNLPAPTINGSNNVCNKTVVTYSTTPGMSNYYWTVSPGGTVLSGGTTSDSTITISWVLAGSRYIKLSYASGAGCTSPVIIYQVTVRPTPTPTITGPASLCNNLTGTYMTEAGMTNYLWMVSAGGMITSGAGTRTITVHWVSAGSKTVTVNYTNSSGCSAAAPVVKNVTVYALPAPTITGPISVCVNTYVNYVTEPGMSNYTWTLGGSGGIIYSGFNSRQIQVKWTATGNKTVSVNYTNPNGCRAETPAILNVTVHICPSPSSPDVKSAEIHSFNVALFPNPNDGSFTLSLELPDKQVCKATVFNLTGVKIYDTENLLIDGLYEQRIDLGSIPEGIYLVVIQSQDNCIVKKILVSH